MSSQISGVAPVDSDFGVERPRRTRTQFRRPQVARTVGPMADVDDGELMVRYAAGDMRAFESLYRRHRSALYRYLARHTRDPEIANDLFQEVWSKVIASRARYEPRAKFSTFLYRVAHNCFIDHCRRATGRTDRTIANNEDFDLENVLPAAAADAPDTRAEHEQTLARYRAALASLPAEQRDAFLLYEESGLSLDEIGQITGVSMETAKSRLRYALAKLRAAMTPQDVAANSTPVCKREMFAREPAAQAAADVSPAAALEGPGT
ncbi:MAG TPA: RNA polymerase sigma factor [Steroidobacteraceae bacterium]|jgi:RNA polymerase sigma-70 factor (ECF subfamily)|nr:RNA polymerase sigma factor [Steroidobacteraceae bacterium]